MAIPLTIVSGGGADVTPPVFVSGPLVDVAADAATFRWTTDEIATGVLKVGHTRPPTDTTLQVKPLGTSQVVQLAPLLPSTLYYYVVSATDVTGNTATAQVDSFTTTAATTEVPGARGPLSLSGGMPNPSDGAVALALELPHDARVTFGVYDLSGREVWQAAPREYAAGRWTLHWPGQSGHGARMRTGLYLARVAVDGVVFTRRLAVLR
jgi:hypothetical protein